MTTRRLLVLAGAAVGVVGRAVASLGWLWAVEGVRPDRWDVVGAGLCLLARP